MTGCRGLDQHFGKEERLGATTNYLVKLVKKKGSSWKNETLDLLLDVDENREPDIIKVRHNEKNESYMTRPPKHQSHKKDYLYKVRYIYEDI